MSTTRLQEVQICFGKGKQTDIATAQLAAAMWRFNKLNAALTNPKLSTENDAEEYGKGHEFPTVTYKTAWDSAARWRSICQQKWRHGRWRLAWARL